MRLLRLGLHELVTNLIPFAFAGLMLGFAAGRSLGSDAKDLVMSWRMVGTVLFHEGIPMLLYTQVRNHSSTPRSRW